MPHLVLSGEIDWQQAAEKLRPAVHRWGRAVLKSDACWLHQKGRALLVEGVVVELSRPLHPVALVSARDNDTVVRLWSVVPVERTQAVQRWLAVIAAQMRDLGAGPLRVTNLPEELWNDLGLHEARTPAAGSE